MGHVYTSHRESYEKQSATHSDCPSAGCGRGGRVHGGQLDGQQTTAQPADYTNAVFAEVRDAQGLIVLRGQFALADEEDDDIERKATLEPTGVDADAAGEAEVEFAAQEVEFAARNLQAGATFTFVIALPSNTER